MKYFISCPGSCREWLGGIFENHVPGEAIFFSSVVPDATGVDDLMEIASARMKECSVSPSFLASDGSIAIGIAIGIEYSGELLPDPQGDPKSAANFVWQTGDRTCTVHVGFSFGISGIDGELSETAMYQTFSVSLRPMWQKDLEDIDALVRAPEVMALLFSVSISNLTALISRKKRLPAEIRKFRLQTIQKSSGYDSSLPHFSWFSLEIFGFTARHEI